MKKYLLVLFLGGFLSISCGSGHNENEKSGEIDSKMQSREAQLDGAKLISSSDCRACHADKETIIGPGYKQIAEKYPDNDSTIHFLAGKIISGGAGNWGSTPMPPHPQHSKEEAAAMARYILTMEK